MEKISHMCKCMVSRLTLPSTIVPSALDSKPLRAFSPVMAGVSSQMKYTDFKKIIYSISSQLKYEVKGLTESGITPNFHVANIANSNKQVYVLCSNDGNWAFSSFYESSECHLSFVDCDDFSKLLFSNYGIKSLSSKELASPFVNNSNIPESDISYWSPKTLGDSLFNWWD